MSESSKKFKFRAFLKEKHIITYCITVLNLIIFLVYNSLDLDASYDSLDFKIGVIYFFIELVLIFPGTLVAYGITSYNATGKIILPNVFLFISTVLICFVFGCINYGRLPTDFLDILRLPAVMCAILLLTSVITAITKKLLK